MSHYFINDDKLKNNIKSFEIKINETNFRFNTDNGVFSKNTLDFGSKLLFESVNTKDAKKIADIGCGYGIIGIMIAKFNPNSLIYMFDINLRAIFLANQNISLNNVNNVIVKQNDGLNDVLEKFDLILTNPPIRAGKKVVNKFFIDAYNHLNNESDFYCVIRKKQGASSYLKKIEELFGNFKIVNKKKGYWIIKATRK